MSVKVTEIFYSIQGESTQAGRPCIFIRLSGCNLRCTWCDTKYAYREGKELLIKDILATVVGFPCRLVEITGGEPLTQPGTARLITTLLDSGFEVMIETNGTIDISKLNTRAKVIMDLKCPSSGESDKIRWENLTSLKPDDELKFVIANRDDYQWARSIIIDQRLAAKCLVLLSPVYQTLQPHTLAKWILTDGLPVRLQIQLHRVIWPESERGV